MKKLSSLLSILLVITLIVPGFAFASNDDTTYAQSDKLEVDNEVSEEFKNLMESINNIIKNKKEDKKFNYDLNELLNKDKNVRIIVELKNDPTIVYATEKGVGYSQLSKNDINDIERNILTEQEAFKNQIKAQNIDMKIINNFTTVFNGFSGEVKLIDIPLIERLSSVKNVYISNEYRRPEITPDMNSSNDMIGTNPTWEAGYKGEGMVIAIIDTGVDPSHNDMKLSNETTPKLTKETIGKLGLPGEYRTTKVPYGYNYYDQNKEILDLGPEASEHGMHVAGTAAANGNIKGVAPEAQILAMKVFSNDPIYSTTFDDIYLKAIEDAIILKADVINMSLGASASFYVEDGATNKAIKNAVDNGIVCSISAGNSAQMVDGWAERYGLPWKENPDIGVVGSPGLCKDSIAVASIENTHMMAQYLEYIIEGAKESLPINAVIVEDKAYDIEYLNSNPDAQMHLIEAYNNKHMIYIKLNSNLIVDISGVEVTDKNLLPTVVEYYDSEGNVSERSPFEGGTGESKLVKAPMTVASTIHPVDVFEGEATFVDCGVGASEDFDGKEIKGKVALIVRGGLPFTEKIINAQNAGAAGVIVYNNADGGDELINMMYPAEGNIPAVFVGYSVGSELLTLENKVLKFSDEYMQILNLDARNMSSFTSWGTTPSLELKPEITAPGGQIYSTLQNNKYGMMSGTSMAAPHVSGGSALVMQYIKQHPKYKSLTLDQQTRLAKVLLMNTANVVIEEDEEDSYIVSPRRQGAGLMNLRAAVNTPVRVVNKATGEAKVELKDFERTNFEMNFTAINDSDKEITYKVDTNVLTDYILSAGNDEYNILITREMVADVTAPNEITVPAKETCDFKVKVDFSSDQEKYRNMFVEGFVTLTEKTDTNPTLSIPYVGFYGDWTEPKILDGMVNIDEKSYFEASGMIYADDQDAYYYDEVNMSPGTYEGMMFGTNIVVPATSFMRNAAEVEYRILDEEGNVLRTLYRDEFVTKNLIDGGRYSPIKISEETIWDGTIRDEYDVVEDGKYFYEIRSKVHYEDADWQVKRIPITVDTIAPEITDLNYDEKTGNITWKANDEGSGLSTFVIRFDGAFIDEIVEAEKGKTNYELDISKYLTENGDHLVEILVFDKAMNYSSDYTNVKKDDIVTAEKPMIYLEKPELFDAKNISTIEASGYVICSNVVESIEIDGQEVPFHFSANIPVLDDEGNHIGVQSGYVFVHFMNFEEDGVKEIKVSAKTKNNLESSIVRTIFVDTTRPEIKHVQILERKPYEKTVTLKVTMSDNFPVLNLYAYNSLEYSFDGSSEKLSEIKPVEKEAEITVTLFDEGINIIPLRLVDFAGNEIVSEVEVERTSISKADLLEKIAEAESKIEADYLPETWEALQNALKEAKRVAELANPTQEELAEAFYGLVDALNNLVENPVVKVSAKYTKLEDKNKAYFGYVLLSLKDSYKDMDVTLKVNNYTCFEKKVGKDGYDMLFEGMTADIPNEVILKIGEEEYDITELINWEEVKADK